ncbi:MAG: hypothetical protein F4X44_12370 [Gammaproteobacteria bacterium]|nr:hypothetical protein [Gammaproteobacteria bacterium]MYD81394.1 hypothetical protein [Gammaproteobacteria bacterium]
MPFVYRKIKIKVHRDCVHYCGFGWDSKSRLVGGTTQAAMTPPQITQLLGGSAFAIFVGIFSVAAGLMAFRFGDGLAPIGIWIGCLELSVASATITVFALRGSIGCKTQGWLLIGCSLLGICTLTGLALVRYLFVYSSDWFFGGLLEITGFLFGVLLVLLLFLGIGFVRATTGRTASASSIEEDSAQ